MSAKNSTEYALMKEFARRHFKGSLTEETFDYYEDGKHILVFKFYTLDASKELFCVYSLVRYADYIEAEIHILNCQAIWVKFMRTDERHSANADERHSANADERHSTNDEATSGLREFLDNDFKYDHHTVKILRDFN